MKTVSRLDELRTQVSEYREKGRRIGFVPTMGNLHAGHLSLVDAARKSCDVVIVSIFVNPLQFGPTEDFDTYPVTPEEDQRNLEKHQATLLYRPQIESIYPSRDVSSHTRISVPDVSDVLCGLSRPHFFSGVATVVNTLFNQVRPDIAYFGKKDYQQFLVIKKMISDLCMNIELEGVETVRTASGLALSSRNNYLSDDELAQAAELHNVLRFVVDGYGTDSAEQLVEQGIQMLNNSGFKADYLSVRRQSDLQLATTDDKKLIVLAAAWLGKTRLIDNVEFELA